MGSLRLLARLQLKRRWRGLALLAIVVGGVGGISASLIAGSRRSASVVDRYFRSGRHYDLNVYTYPALTLASVERLPGVRRADPNGYLAMARLAPDGTADVGI